MTLLGTKIICTIGPASESAHMVDNLIRAGMNVARLNFAHGTHEEHINRIRHVRESAANHGLPVGILLDIPGPKIRTGRLRKKRVHIEQDSQITLTPKQVMGNEHLIPISIPGLAEAVKPGSLIYLDEGEIKLEVIDITGINVVCKVIVSGELGSEKGINVPGASLNVPAITQTDIEHVLLGIEYGVDFFALSFVRKAQDISLLKEILRQRNSDTPIIAKIENHEALRNIDEIIAASDGLMIARGDLGIEIPIERTPIVQKEIIRKCNHAGKPVIVATQMLESMGDSPYPTRAEVTDVANAIFDGADAIMLSGETAVGKYPFTAVQMMIRIARESESMLRSEPMGSRRETHLEPQPDDAISFAACHTAHQLEAKAIIALTATGSTAQRVSKYRPHVPILAIASSDTICRRLALTWGVYPYEVARANTLQELFAQGATLSREKGLASDGDLVIITAGLPIGVEGSTNMLKVETIQPL